MKIKGCINPVNLEHLDILLQRGIYPIEAVDDLGNTHYGYPIDINGCYIGTMRKPKMKSWLNFRYGINLPVNQNEQQAENNIFSFMDRLQKDFDVSMRKELEYFKEHGHVRKPTEDELFMDHLKLAKVDGNITLVHNQTMQAYQTIDPYIDKTATQYELFYPITPIDGHFEKWCTGFDL